jgi:D-amino-acid dehydrogenase
MRVLVVGSGIFGASLAYSLTKAGAEVIVADEGHAGRATGAGAGIVCPWATREDDVDFYRFYEAGYRHYLGIIPELDEAGVKETGYSKVGGLVIAETETEADEVSARLERRIAGAPEAGQMTRLTGRDVQSYFPPLREGLTAFHVSGGARIEARTVAAALLHAARIKGATTLSGHVSIRLRGKTALASINGENLAVDRIALTTGAWMNDLLGSLGLSVPVEPQKGQIVHLQLHGYSTDHWPVVLPQGSHYMLAFPGGRIVVGATRETGSGFDYRLTAGGQAEVLNFALSLAPGLAAATHLETRIGFRPFYTAKKPIIDQAPGFDNLFLGNGLGSGGLTMGPLAGHLLAQLIVGQIPDINLSPYALPVPNQV